MGFFDMRTSEYLVCFVSYNMTLDIRLHGQDRLLLYMRRLGCITKKKCHVDLKSKFTTSMTRCIALEIRLFVQV